jgi:hypothetical protein
MATPCPITENRCISRNEWLKSNRPRPIVRRVKPDWWTAGWRFSPHVRRSVSVGQDIGVDKFLLSYYRIITINGVVL